MVPHKASKLILRILIHCSYFFLQLKAMAMESQFAMEDVKRLINSHRGYRSHLKWLLSIAGETMEWCSNSTSEMDDATLLADLIKQLEHKRTILVDLGRQISASISDNDLEAEILKTEKIQSELSSTMAWVKHLMQQFQCHPLSSLIITLTSFTHH